MEQGIIEARLTKYLAISGLTALGLLAIAGCGSEHQTIHAVHEVTSTGNLPSTAKPNNTKLNMALDLCANQAITSKMNELAHTTLTCIKSPASYNGASSKEEESEEYAWYNPTTSVTMFNVALEYYPGNDELFYAVDKAVGGKDEPIGDTRCVLKRDNDLKINGFDCFLSEHYYTSITDANGLQFPASTYQSITQLVIAEASK